MSREARKNKMIELILIFGRAYCFTIGGKADRKINKVSPYCILNQLKPIFKGHWPVFPANVPENTYNDRIHFTPEHLLCNQSALGLGSTWT